jgi:MAPEG family
MRSTCSITGYSPVLVWSRFALPKLYAEGFSEEAKQFNCVQRGHQQALETYSQFLGLSLIGGISFPVSATIGGIMWSYARLTWANGYATGEPGNRYSHWASRWIWTGLLVEMTAAAATAVKLVIQ